MQGESLLETLYRLGISTSYSRPRTSNANTYSEALFRTCKYRPDYPAQGFASLEAARAWMQQFVPGYNHEHRHSGIRFVTPAQRHQGQDPAILARRQAVYKQARERHPERWSGPIRNWQPITEVWLNPSVNYRNSGLLFSSAPYWQPQPAYCADAVRVHLVERGEEADGGLDVFGAGERGFKVARQMASDLEAAAAEGDVAFQGGVFQVDGTACRRPR